MPLIQTNPTPLRTDRNRLNKRLELLLLILTFVSYGYFYQAGGQNENSRLDLTRSIVEHGEFSISRYPNTGDAIRINNNIYSDKAPGTAFVAVLPWLVTDSLLEITGNQEYRAGHLHCYLTTLFVVGIASCLSTILLFRILNNFGDKPIESFWLSTAYAIGTPAFSYATVLMSHQLTAALILSAFYLLFRLRYNRDLEHGENSRKVGNYSSLLGAGFLSGFAIATEYPAALAAFFLSLYCIRVSKSKTDLSIYVLGLIVGILPLLAYNASVFGNPFQLSYSAYQSDPNSPFEDYHVGLLGFRLPDWMTLYKITFDPQRGLFFCTPWLILFIPSLCWIFRNHTFRNEMRCARAIVVSFALMNSSFGRSILAWGGGAAFGPRHLIATIPFMVMLVLPQFSKKSIVLLAYFLIPISILTNLSAVYINPRTPYLYSNPVLSYYLPRLIQNLPDEGFFGTFTSSIVSGYSIRTTAGALLGVPPGLELFPLWLCWTIVSFAALRVLRIPVRNSIGFLIPPILALLISMVIIPLHLTQRRSTSANTNIEFPVQHLYLRGIAWSSPSVELVRPTYKSELVLGKQSSNSLSSGWDSTDPPFLDIFSVESRTILEVVVPGEYQFELTSDDGSVLYLNRQLLVENWGNHPKKTKSAVIYLNAGKYLLTLRYYNFGGSSSFNLKLTPPSSGDSPIESSASFRLLPIPSDDRIN